MTKSEMQAQIDGLLQERDMLRDFIKSFSTQHLLLDQELTILRRELTDSVSELRKSVQTLGALHNERATGTAATAVSAATVANNPPPSFPVDSYTIYCDGACIANGSENAAGGWGTLIISATGEEFSFAGGEVGTTNNRMEMMAAIRGLEKLPAGCTVTLISDSKYLLNGLQKGWASSWRRNGWRKADGTMARNPDLWDLLLKLTKNHSIEYQWVRGHTGNPYNERCDALAVEAAASAGNKTI